LVGHHEKTDECESCLFPTTELVEVEALGRIPGIGVCSPDEDKVWAWVCKVCYGSYAGLAYCYPRNYENPELYAMIAWSTNRILQEINKPKEY